MKAVGARLPRYDGVGHVTGRTQYVDDVRVGRTLWVKALRSPHHHAAITKLDTAKAEAMEGVYAVITHKDVSRNVYGHLEGLGVPGDEPLLADGEARYKGQPIAAVAHGGTIGAYLAHLFGMHRSLWMAVENTSLTRVLLGADGPNVITANDCNHLYDPVIGLP